MLDQYTLTSDPYGHFAVERYETQKKLKIELILNLHLFQHKKHN